MELLGAVWLTGREKRRVTLLLTGSFSVIVPSILISGAPTNIRRSSSDLLLVSSFSQAGKREMKKTKPIIARIVIAVQNSNDSFPLGKINLIFLNAFSSEISTHSR
jgi:hypothetical protein